MKKAEWVWSFLEKTGPVYRDEMFKTASLESCVNDPLGLVYCTPKDYAADVKYALVA